MTFWNAMTFWNVIAFQNVVWAYLPMNVPGHTVGGGGDWPRPQGVTGRDRTYGGITRIGRI